MSTTTQNSLPGTTAQPPLTVEHRVLMAKCPNPAEIRSQRLEKILNKFYSEHGAGWELINVSRVGGTDYPSLNQNLLLIFQRRRYEPSQTGGQD